MNKEKDLLEYGLESPIMEVKLTNTLEYGGFVGEDCLEGFDGGEEVGLVYQEDTGIYLVVGCCRGELGEIDKKHSKKLRKLEEKGKRFYGEISCLECKGEYVYCTVIVYLNE